MDMRPALGRLTFFRVIRNEFRFSDYTSRPRRQWFTAGSSCRVSLPSRKELKGLSDVKSQTAARDEQPDESPNEADSGRRNEPSRRRTFSWTMPRPSLRARRWLWRLLFIAPPLAVFLLQFPLRIKSIHGSSMVPLLNAHSSPDLPEKNDYILIQNVRGIQLSNLTLGPRWKAERGQIVVYYAPHDPNTRAVKRVIGVPGDRVKPLAGYPGGDEPVVIPYNHIWVEGDANSRDKSVDSNYFGPISQNMVTGVVLQVWTPWNSPVSIRGQEHDYPAKKSGRVEMDVVHNATVHPDSRESQGDAFRDGTAARELAVMRHSRDRLLTMMRDGKKLQKLRLMYSEAREELGREDHETQEVAQGLIAELEVAFEAVGLNKDGSIAPPTQRNRGTAGDDHDPKRRQLEEYLEKHQ